MTFQLSKERELMQEDALPAQILNPAPIEDGFEDDAANLEE